MKQREEILQNEPVIDAPVYADRAILSSVNIVHLLVQIRSRAPVILAAVLIQHNAHRRRIAQNPVAGRPVWRIVVEANHVVAQVPANLPVRADAGIHLG